MRANRVERHGGPQSPRRKDPERRFQLHEEAYIEAFLRGEDAADDHCRELFAIAEATSSDDRLTRALTARCRLGLRHEAAAGVEADPAMLARIGARLGDSIHAAFAPHMLANLREMQDRPTELAARPFRWDVRLCRRT